MRPITNQEQLFKKSDPLGYNFKSNSVSVMGTVEVTYTVGAPQITSSSGRGSVLLTAVNYLDCGLPCTYRSDRHQFCGCYINTNPSETRADEHPLQH